MATADWTGVLNTAIAGGVVLKVTENMSGKERRAARKQKGVVFASKMTIVDVIKRGDRVTIVDRFGKERTGTAVMRSKTGGWVLNMGGKHGTPGLADADNIVKLQRKKR